jgi:hypothetical protein
MVLGLVLWSVGLTSQDAAIRFIQIASLVALGSGIGWVWGYGPSRFLRKILGLDRPNVSTGDCIASATFAALRGLYVGPAAVVVAGFVIGGIVRAAPCHSAPDFLSGAIFGAFGGAYILGLPAAGVGAASGGVVAALLNRWQPHILVIDFVTAVVTLLLMLLYACFFVH